MEARSVAFVRLIFLAVALVAFQPTAYATYTGSATVAGPNLSIQSAATEILGSGGGTGVFTYKGGGNAVDAVVAAALAACVVDPGDCSLGGYGGHMMIWKAGLDGQPQLLTCIDFNTAAGSLANSNIFASNVNPTNGNWTGPLPAANLQGWKAAGVPGTFAGLFMAQTNYGRKMSGTNYFPFAEILKPALARVANGQATGNAYYTLSSVSNLLIDLYTNSPGYLDGNGHPNTNSINNPYTVFYSGDIALDIAAAMQTYGGLVTYSDMTNYRPREVQPYLRHFSPPNGTPAWVCVAPPGSSGLSVLEELATLEALGWTNGPSGSWDSVHYWHSRAETARLMWKDHFQWLGDPWAGILPPNFLGNGSTNFADQILAHVTNGYPFACPWDTNEVRLTNSIAGSITTAVNGETNVPILVHWNDVRYGTCNISTSDQWGNCVALTFSMGDGFGAQVAVTNRGIVLGQGMALFDPRPGWPNSIAPGKRPVDNMCPTIVFPDYPTSSTNGTIGGRPPFAVGGVGGSTIENNMAMQVLQYLLEPPSSRAAEPSAWLYNFEANNVIYMRPSYPPGVQSYLPSVGLSAPGGPPSSGDVSYVEAWVPPVISSQPASTNIVSGSSVSLAVTATGLPLFYQWLKNGVPLIDGPTVSGSQTPNLTLTSITNGAGYSVVVTNGGLSVTSALAAITVGGAPAIVTQPTSRTNLIGTPATFTVSAIGFAPLTYQWLKNGAKLTDGGNLSGATNSTLSLGSVTADDDGSYWVVVTNQNGSATSLAATLTVLNPPIYLSLLWSVGPADGQAWMSTNSPTFTQYAPNQRTIAYNALSNHLYVVSRSSSTTSNFVVYVLNATNGAFLYTLKTNGIQCNVGKAGIGLVGITVADDGAIYACNTALDAEGSGGTDPTSLFRLYRWANANSNTSPSLIFSGDPSGATSALRWGDNIAVRGVGTNTQILLDADTVVSGNRYASVLSPVNGSMASFSPDWFVTGNFANTIGRSLEYDSANNAIWQKGASMALVKTTFDPATSLGGTQISSATALAASSFPTGLLGVGLDLTRNLAAGVFSNNTAAADSLNLYGIGDPNTPVLLAQYDFPTVPAALNVNRISQSFFKSNLLFSIDANNGLMVFRVAGTGAPLITTQPQSQQVVAGATARFTVGASGASLAYQWTKDGGNISGASATALEITGASETDVAAYAVIVANSYGGITTAPPAMLTLSETNPPGLFLYEPFDYANVGGPVSSNTPANWTYGGTGANDLSVVGGNLSWPGLAVSVGNSVTNGGDGLGVRRLFGTNFSTGKIYFSALFRINDLGFGAWSGQASALGALTATDNTSFRLQVLVKSNSPSGYVIGTEKSGTGAAPVFDGTEHHAGDTIFLVGKYDFTVVPNTATLWINPASSALGAVSEPSTNFISASTGTDGFTIDRFNLRQNATTGSSSVPAAIQWDELRFGLSWADVTPPASSPLPTPVELTAFARLADGAFQFAYSNNDGQTYSVFASTNLVNWQSIGAAIQISPGLFQFTDSETTNLPQRFYQLRSQ